MKTIENYKCPDCNRESSYSDIISTSWPTNSTRARTIKCSFCKTIFTKVEEHSYNY